MSELTTDLALEARILACLEDIITAKTNFQKRLEASRLRALISQRSQAQIERMQRAKGLA